LKNKIIDSAYFEEYLFQDDFFQVEKMNRISRSFWRSWDL